MPDITIKPTNNPSIVKFEFPDFIAGSTSYEFKNIDEASASPLAKQLFYLPFVKSVYISQNFVAIERYNIVEWEDVQEDVAEQIQNFVNNGGEIITKPKTDASRPVEVYGEITPNPSALKFVASIMLTRTPVEYKNIDQAFSSPLAKALFELPYVREVFIDENYVSVTKYDSYDWSDISQELRGFIKNYIASGGPILDESLVQKHTETQQKQDAHFDTLDPISQRIINILEEYVHPAVAADGGNIAFDSYDESEKRVKVILQGACNGCPSSTFTLKSGIENMLRDMLKDDDIRVEALNA